MKNLILNYHKNILLLCFTIAIPLLGTSLLLITLLSFPKESFGVLTISSIVISTFLMALILYWAINKEINIPCQVEINEKGIGYKFLRRSLFYRHKDFYAGWENVTGISEVFCSATGKYFYRLKFQKPNTIVNFSPFKEKDDAADYLFSELDYYQNTFLIGPAKVTLKKQASQKLAQA